MRSFPKTDRVRAPRRNCEMSTPSGRPEAHPSATRDRYLAPREPSKTLVAARRRVIEGLHHDGVRNIGAFSSTSADRPGPSCATARHLRCGRGRRIDEPLARSYFRLAPSRQRPASDADPNLLKDCTAAAGRFASCSGLARAGCHIQRTHLRLYLRH